MQRRSVICVVGESLIDLVDDGSGRPPVANPGGSPLNIAVGLGRLGQRPVLLTHIGHDAYGELLRTRLAANGVQWRECGDPNQPTSLATARLDADRHATYEFEVAWDVAPLDLPDDACALHVGSLGATLEPGAERVAALVRATAPCSDVLISYDPNARPALTTDRSVAAHRFWDLATRSHVVKLSDEDLAFLTGGVDFEVAADRMLAGGTAAIVVMTRGSQGATARTMAGTVTVPAIPTAVADTVGAGDSFTAALLHGLAESNVLSPLGTSQLASDLGAVESLLTYASKAAAVTVGRVGADPPTAEEVESTTSRPRRP